MSEKPSRQEVFDELRRQGCCWVGGHGCECRSRQLKSCYEIAEKNLMPSPVFTPSEAEEAQGRLNKAFDDLFKEWEVQA